jgi:hypothetical protein
MKSIIFWDMTPCSPLSFNRRCCLSPACLLVFCWIYFLDLQDGGDMFLRNVGWNSTDYTASYPRRWYSSLPPMWKPQTLHIRKMFLCCPGESREIFRGLQYIKAPTVSPCQGCMWTQLHYKQEVLGRTNRLLSLIRHEPYWKWRVQHFFYCCVCIRYSGNVYTEPLPSNDKRIF